MIFETALGDPLRPATADLEGTRSYAEIAAAAVSVARFLDTAPAFHPGGHVALVLDSTPAYAAAFHGVLLAGGVAVPIPPTLPEERIDELVAWTECCLRLEDHSGSEGSTPAVQLRAQLDGARPRPAGRPGKLAAILLTSGSTGPPKGVMLSGGNLHANADAIRRSWLGLRASDRALVTLPFHHAFGNSVLQSHLVAGSCLVFDDAASGPTPLAAVDRHRITALYAVPDQCVLLARSLRGRPMPESARFLAVAGGRLAPELGLRLAEMIAPAELIVMYGQTEATARLTCLDPTWFHRAPDSIGRPIPGVEIEVVDEQGGALGPGAVGAIRARGPGSCLGYWREPAASSQILRGGWLWTGDLGSVDELGLLHHAGRADDVVKIGGRRVDLGRLCREIESGIGAARCVAVPFETAEGAQRCALFVVGPESRRDAALAWCRTSLSRDERPAVIEALAGIPTLESGKPDTNALAARARLQWSRAIQPGTSNSERES
jgi:acyl-CoA synthetase (AMP-forming)/AMP-acid ligase II